MSVDATVDRLRRIDALYANLERVNLSALVEDEQECGICFESYNSGTHYQVKLMNCGHVFAAECLIKWAMKHNTCPHCRSQLYVSPPRIVLAQELPLRTTDTTRTITTVLALPSESQSQYQIPQMSLHRHRSRGLRGFFRSIFHRPSTISQDTTIPNQRTPAHYLQSRRIPQPSRGTLPSYGQPPWMRGPALPVAQRGPRPLFSSFDGLFASIDEPIA